MRKPFRRAAFSVFLLVAGVYTVHQWRGPNGWEALKSRHARVAELNAEIANAKSANTALEKQIKDLSKKDRLDLEMRKIDMLPNGEIQFRVEEPKAAPVKPGDKPKAE